MEINITILFQIAVFLVLLGSLSKILFKPLLKLIDERERRIAGAQAEARDILAIAFTRKQEVEARITAAQKEARAVLENLKAEGARYHQQIIESARADAHAQLKEGLTQLAADTQKVRASLLAETDALTDAVLAKFIHPLGNTSPHTAPKMECSGAF